MTGPREAGAKPRGRAPDYSAGSEAGAPSRTDPAQKSKPFRFAATLAETRRRNGLTLGELAEQSGLSTSAVWDAEKGGGRVDTMLRLLDALDVRLAGLPASGGPTIHGRLRAARERRGWSIPEAARRAGVSPAALRRVEEGTGRVTTLEAALAVLAPHARVRAEERARWQSGRRDMRLTPPAVIEALRRVVGRAFDVDPAHHSLSAVGAATAYGVDDDGLSRVWRGAVFLNPPFSGAASFIRRAYEAWHCGEAEVVVLLLAAQLHQAVWHQFVFGSAEVFVLRGRMRFIGPDGEVRDRAPFPVVVAIYGSDEAMVGRMLDEFDCVRIPTDVQRGRRRADNGLTAVIG